MNGGWMDEGSPFHRGEQEVQARLGVREKAEGLGRRFIYDHLPEQHRDFYARLPFVLVGTGDGEGWPWASILNGPPGFIACPDPWRLKISARPAAGDPLSGALKDGAEIGVLGIELETRRRNRVSGTVQRVTDGGFEIAVRQAFGNCPRYIQTRTVRRREAARAPGGDGAVQRGDRLDAGARELISRADTFFIATFSSDANGDATTGADVSHRGGRPGFVRVEDERTLSFPDFSGNRYFNTIGNLMLNPRAGLLFIDFLSGYMLQMTGNAEVVWDGEEVRAFAGAERLLRFRTRAMIRIGAALPLQFEFGEYSPSLSRTGTWAQALETIGADRARPIG